MVCAAQRAQGCCCCHHIILFLLISTSSLLLSCRMVWCGVLCLPLLSSHFSVHPRSTRDAHSVLAPLCSCDVLMLILVLRVLYRDVGVAAWCFIAWLLVVWCCCFMVLLVGCCSVCFVCFVLSVSACHCWCWCVLRASVRALCASVLCVCLTIWLASRRTPWSLLRSEDASRGDRDRDRDRDRRERSERRRQDGDKGEKGCHVTNKNAHMYIHR